MAEDEEDIRIIPRFSGTIVNGNTDLRPQLQKAVIRPIERSNFESGFFSSCTGLKDVSISNIDDTGDEAFKDCTSLSSVVMDSIARIGNDAFLGCINLSSITIPFIFGALVYYICFFIQIKRANKVLEKLNSEE